MKYIFCITLTILISIGLMAHGSDCVADGAASTDALPLITYNGSLTDSLNNAIITQFRQQEEEYFNPYQETHKEYNKQRALAWIATAEPAVLLGLPQIQQLVQGQIDAKLSTGDLFTKDAMYAAASNKVNRLIATRALITSKEHETSVNAARQAGQNNVDTQAQIIKALQAQRDLGLLFTREQLQERDTKTARAAVKDYESKMSFAQKHPIKLALRSALVGIGCGGIFGGICGFSLGSWTKLAIKGRL